MVQASNSSLSATNHALAAKDFRNSVSALDVVVLSPLKSALAHATERIHSRLNRNKSDAENHRSDLQKIENAIAGKASLLSDRHGISVDDFTTIDTVNSYQILVNGWYAPHARTLNRHLKVFLPLSPLMVNSFELESTADKKEYSCILRSFGETYYRILGVIESGDCAGCGEVVEALSSLGDQVAIRINRKIAHGWPAAETRRVIINERNILVKISTQNFPFLTQALDCFQDADNVYFAMRLHPGNLAQLAFSNVSVTLGQYKIYAAELLLGIEALHSLNIVHRDLKPSNILVSPNGHLAIANFGLSHAFDLELSPTSIMYKLCGTPGYFAPEMISPEATSKGYNSAVDIWGYGMILFELFAGQRCVDGESPSGQFKLNRKFADAASLVTDICVLHESLADLLKWTLAPLASSRPTWAEIRDHAFFEDSDWDAVKARGLPVQMPKPSRQATKPYQPTTPGPLVRGQGTRFRDYEVEFRMDDEIWIDNMHGRLFDEVAL